MFSAGYKKRMNDFSSKIRGAIPVVSWSLYDLANQFFGLNIISLYFVRWLTFDKSCPEFYYSIAFGVSTLLVALVSPLLGTIADEMARSREFLSVLTFLSILFTMLLGFTSHVPTALIFFGIANFGCQTAVVFYNSLLKQVASPRRVGLVSGLGRMFAYIGTIIALLIAKPIVLQHGYQAVFFPTGVLFLVFALPCMIFVKEPVGHAATADIHAFLKRGVLRRHLKKLSTIVFSEESFPELSRFLKATFFCLCSVNVVVLFMAVYATRVFGLNEGELINLMSVSTIFAVGGSFLSGIISDRFGDMRVLRVVFFMWIVCFSVGAFAASPFLYWIIGGFVGLTMGATWVVLRAVTVRLAPEGELGEIFGLFNFLAYFSAVVGAFFWGALTLVLRRFGTNGYRAGLFSLIIFLLIGFFYLMKIPCREPVRHE